MDDMQNVLMDADKKTWKKVSDYMEQPELLQLGTYFTHMINCDIKHLVFTLSRYKFASKLLMYKENINLLELGCQEAWGGLLFRQENKLSKYVGIDFDEEAIRWNQEHFPFPEFEFIHTNIFDYKVPEENFDAIISLDVIEHIFPEMENRYCDLIYTGLKQDGIAIVGTPNITLSPYASEGSKIGHVNLYDQKRLYELMSKYFHNVLIFNMNDEVVNTGFAPMSCYIFAVCCNKKLL